MTGSSPSEPAATPAATAIVMRAASVGPPELLMVERARALRFAGGALVFPGGRVDPEDVALAGVLGDAGDELSARIAAIRETIEEVGVPAGIEIAPEHLAELRRALHAGAPFGELIAQAGARLRPDLLVPFARWLPHGVPHRVFDTRFYLVAAPENVEPVADGGETARAFWATAQSVLDDAAAGRATIIFPTRRNLERLATFASFDAAAAHAAACPVRTITPWIERRGEEDHLCIPEGLGYPVTAERVSTALRG